MNNEKWFCCPVCHKKLFKIKEKGKVKNIEIKCGRCRSIIQVNSEPMSLSK